MAFKLGDVIIDRLQFGYGALADKALYALTQLQNATIDITADTIPYADSMISNNFDTTAVSNDYVDDYVETADVEPQDLQETQPKHKQNKKKNGILSKAKNFMESFFD